MIKNTHPQWIALALACLVSVSSAQTVAFELTYSTSNSSTLILTSPNLTAADSEAVSYGYSIDSEGNISEATAFLFSDDSVTGNNDKISGLSRIPGSSSYYLATSTSSVWGTLTFEPDDIVLFDPVLNTASTFWEGDEHSTTGFVIDGLHVYADGSFLLSTTNTETIYGQSFRDGDIALINPNTSSASLFFNRDLLGGSGNIDALTIDADSGNLVFSTSTSDSLGGVSFDDGDLVMWNGMNALVVFWERHHFSRSEDINALGSFRMSVPEPSATLLILASFTCVVFRGRR